MMRSPSFLLTSLVSFLGISSAVALPSLTRDTASSGCVNSPSNRSCWSDGFDISTNYYEHVPDTGVVREYWFNIENTTASPNGVEMPVQLINGSFPGPTIVANWGDTVGKSISIPRSAGFD